MRRRVSKAEEIEGEDGRSDSAPKAQPRDTEKAKGNYFKKSSLDFINSGCVTFDCVLGGGWPLGRISNIIGDKSTGKTLCAIEACANFIRKYPDGHIWYRESEAAFDEDYAESLGLPLDKVDFGPDGIDTIWETVEDVFDDLTKCIKQAEESGQPGLYIIDSIDALSSRPELDRAIDEGSYGMEKQKLLGRLFRQHNKKMQRSKIHFLMISQVRDNIGAMFGNKQRRAGGKSMDFYASQIVWLSHLGQISKTIGGLKRTTGVKVRVKCSKNKISLPFRECEFSIRFGYGIDELPAALTWLDSAGKGKPILNGEKLNTFLTLADKLPDKEYRTLLRTVRKAVRAAWSEIDEKFAPPRRKY